MNCLLEIRRYRLPLRAAVRTAHGVMTEREGVMVRLEDEAGRAGLGEAAPVPGFGVGTADEAETALRALGGRVSALALTESVAKGGCAGFALESARGEILGQTCGAANSRTLPMAALLPAGRSALEKIRALGEAGFRTFKWKVGVAAVREELPLLDEVCAELPKGARLRLDANGAWDRRAAERWLERCAERPVEFVEQPCFAQVSQSAARGGQTEDLLHGLAEDYPTAIALDESLAGEGDVERWLAAGWRGVWIIKPSLLGGATLARLRTAGADVVFSSALETAVGARAALRMAFGWGERKESGVRSQPFRQAQGPERVEGESGGAAKIAERPPRALGFGVWPLFADPRFDGPYLAPFLRAEDVERINGEAVWNALS